jgi:NAD(P)-dependent dehydrogenase (short-subunit alcohol dehydrogenase family)
VDTAVVTGAARGFGREIARLLVARGYAVLLTDVESDAVRRAAEELGEPAWAMELQVTEPEAHRRVAAEAASRGPLKVWVNNAGILRTRKAWEHDDEEVRSLIDIDLLGVIWGSQAAVQAMGAAGGHIVNLGSMASLGPVPGLALYAAAKHGVLGYTVSLQGDLDAAGLPIRTHVLCPDAAATDMVRERRDEPDSALLFTAPRLLDAREVAERAVALIDGDRLIDAFPKSRALLIRAAAPFPRANLRLLPLFRRLGDRKRRSTANP